MLNIRHILRLYTQNQTRSEIILQTGIHRPILKGLIDDFKASKLSFAEINELSDKDLEELFKKPPEQSQSEKLKTLYSLFPEIDKELKRKGVNKGLLWEEYKKKISRWRQFHFFSHALCEMENKENTNHAPES